MLCAKRPPIALVRALDNWPHGCTVQACLTFCLKAKRPGTCAIEGGAC